jgi:hypothetical protein
MLPRLTETTKPIARIEVNIRIQPENWDRKTGFGHRTGQRDMKTKQKTARFVTITKHQKPDTEEADQVDEFVMEIDEAEAKTVEIEARADVTGNVKGTGDLELDVEAGGEWAGAAAGEWSGGIGTAVLPGEMDIDRQQDATTKTQIPQIAIKEPKKAGKTKWKMIPRETGDSGARQKEEFFMQWNPGSGGHEDRAGVIYKE